MIKILVDSVGFAGSANCEIVKKRKETIKDDLAPKFKRLCSNPKFSGESLFGEKLVQDVKEINELGKVTSDLAKPGPLDYKSAPKFWN